MRKRGNLVHIEPGMFCIGMCIKAPIYYMRNEKPVLLCKDVVFTEQVLDKLHRISNKGDNLYVQEENYEEIWTESIRLISADSTSHEIAYQKVRNDYDQVLAKTVGFLGDISKNGTLPMRLAEEIASEISNDINKNNHSLVLHCVNMINAADSYLYTHCLNVATLNGLIGKWMNLSDTQIKELIQCGLMHDLGKLKIDPDILNKPGKLTEDEFAQIKQHSIYSFQMLLQNGERNRNILSAVRQHHEKPNGKGYPDGLTRDQICLLARITSVSDVYDAMVSKRCYKQASTPFDVLELFKINRFSDLDMEVVDIFLQNAAYLLIGMHVKLSNGETGEVVYLSPNDLANPVVKVGERVFSTSGACRCIETESNF